MSKKNPTDTEQYKLWNKLEKDRVFVKETAGTKRSRNIVITIKKLYQCERLLWMIEDIVSSDVWKQHRQLMPIQHWFAEFGADVVIADWQFVGVAITSSPAMRYAPGMFVVKYDEVNARKLSLETEFKQRVNANTGNHRYKVVLTHRDQFGRKLPKPVQK